MNKMNKNNNYDRMSTNELKALSFNEKAALVHEGKYLDVFVDDERLAIRAWVADQGYGLDQLVYDDAAGVRMAVARQGYGLDLLCEDPCEQVRKEAWNKQIELLKKQLADAQAVMASQCKTHETIERLNNELAAVTAERDALRQKLDAIASIIGGQPIVTIAEEEPVEERTEETDSVADYVNVVSVPRGTVYNGRPKGARDKTKRSRVGKVQVDHNYETKRTRLGTTKAKSLQEIEEISYKVLVEYLKHGVIRVRDVWGKPVPQATDKTGEGNAYKTLRKIMTKYTYKSTTDKYWTIDKDGNVTITMDEEKLYPMLVHELMDKAYNDGKSLDYYLFGDTKTHIVDESNLIRYYNAEMQDRKIRKMA